jgi:putative serine protease PepD
MTDDHPHDDAPPTEESPWWSRPSGGSSATPQPDRDPRPPRPAGAADQADQDDADPAAPAPGSDEAPTTPVERSPWAPTPSYQPPSTYQPASTYQPPSTFQPPSYDPAPPEAAPTAPTASYGDPARSVWDAHDSGETAPHSLWAAPDDEPDTIGSAPRDRTRSRAATLVAGALAIALIAGVAGGVAGFLLARRDNNAVTIDGADLGAAPARSVQRPDGSIAAVAAHVLPSVVQIKVDTAQGQATGSGFVIDEDGLIVTNNHVVAGRQGTVQVTFSNGKNTTARVLGTSASYDLAVIRVQARKLTALPLGNSDSIVVGDPVIAIGSPLGLSGTVTTGIISAKNRPVTAGDDSGNTESSYINAVQTDAAINPGNSGGPLVDLDGEVIGVNSAIATVSGAGFGQESGNIGVGFAIPINQARRTVEQLINNGEAQFPIIGASLDGSYDGPGARIATSAAQDGTPPLRDGGPADKAGLQPGDVIVALNGKKVDGSAELIVAIRAHKPGDTVTLRVRRAGDNRSVRVTLGATKG